MSLLMRTPCSENPANSSKKFPMNAATQLLPRLPSGLRLLGVAFLRVNGSTGREIIATPIYSEAAFTTARPSCRSEVGAKADGAPGKSVRCNRSRNGSRCRCGVARAQRRRRGAGRGRRAGRGGRRGARGRGGGGGG